MRVTLTFDLPDEREACDLALAAPGMYRALSDLREFMRATRKHDPAAWRASHEAEAIWDEFHRLTQAYEVPEI